MDNGYYKGIDMEKAIEPQTILADEMNSEPLPVAHDVSLRLRLESQLGYKMSKCGSVVSSSSRTMAISGRDRAAGVTT